MIVKVENGSICQSEHNIFHGFEKFDEFYEARNKELTERIRELLG